MVTARRKGVLVWVFGFLTFLMAINSINASILWWQHGDGYVIPDIHLFGITVFNELSVEIFFLLWTLLTALFLGITISYAFRAVEEPTSIVQGVVDPDRIEGMSKSLESYRKNFLGFLGNLSETRKQQSSSIGEVKMTLNKVLQELEKLRKSVEVMGEVTELRARLRELEKLVDVTAGSSAR